MTFYADLHVHSRYARATSKNLNLENLALWARKKGIAVVGTGDFTHPAWRAELKSKLVPAEPGLYRLLPEIERDINSKLPSACRGFVRFMLEVEVSTIYKKDELTRKIHHLLYASNFAEMDNMVARLDKIGNLEADGRPILGLDSRDLLEIVLDSGEHTYLIPAHIWTPWFAAMGSKSGFDSIEACYGDLAKHIFAVETGLSSDPPMNWRVSSLDRFRLVSNSDAHSPPKLGREATVFHTDLDYFAMRRALETGEGFGGTVEFFPEEGKYHMDGHRACKVRLSPEQTRQARGVCPECGRSLTVGVMHRVDALADRPDGWTPETSDPFRSFVPLPEAIGEIEQVGPKSQRVARIYEGLLGRLGPELEMLEHTPVEDIRRASSTLIAESIERMRRGDVICEPGYDGKYGVVRMFAPEEMGTQSLSVSLFGTTHVPRKSTPRQSEKTNQETPQPASAAPEPQPTSQVQPALQVQPPTPGLNPEQSEAVEAEGGPMLVVAGPGTGKTRTLIHRLAHLIGEKQVAPEHCLAITFTRRAAEEMRERLEAMLPKVAQRVLVTTFHGLALEVLRESGHHIGLHRGFRVASARDQLAILENGLGISERKAKRFLSAISILKRTDQRPEPGSDEEKAFSIYIQGLDVAAMVDFDDLISLTVRLLEEVPEEAARYRDRFRWVSIDEYQDIDARQYQMVRLLVPEGGNLCAIGDPDQAIYGFRGADVGFFLRFEQDFPGTRRIRLFRNYRSTPTIVEAALQVMGAAQTPDPTRRLEAAARETGAHIVLYNAATEKSEAEFIVKTLEKLLGGHTFFSIDSGRSTGAEDSDYSFSDFAVLYRTAAQAEALVEALQRSGIPFQSRSHGRLMDQPSVHAFVEHLRESAPSSEGFNPTQTHSSTQKGSSSPLKPRLEAVAAEMGEPGALALELLLPIAARHADDDIAQFCDRLALGTEMEGWDPRAERVSLLTLHASKGLEFKVVFLAGCEDGLLPLRWGDESNTEEERRLFYVGVTRAKERLYLLRAGKRLRHGEVRPAEPSPFLADIAPELSRVEAPYAPKKQKRELEDKPQLSLW